MNTKTMEGLVGARTNINLLNTPFRVYKEARRRGDTAVMERAMGYVNEFSDKSEEYQAEADRGMEEDAEAAREKAKAEREKAIRKRKEERRELEEKIEKSRDENREAGIVNVSEEGKTLLKENTEADHKTSGSMEQENTASAGAKINKEPVIYTKTGEVSQAEQTGSLSVSV